MLYFLEVIVAFEKEFSPPVSFYVDKIYKNLVRGEHFTSFLAILVMVGRFRYKNSPRFKASSF